jgi:hypothetical protein
LALTAERPRSSSTPGKWGVLELEVLGCAHMNYNLARPEVAQIRKEEVLTAYAVNQAGRAKQ